MSKSERLGCWLGATLKVFGAWAVVHIAFVADQEPRVFRVLGCVLIFMMIREQMRWARLRIALTGSAA